MTVLCPGCRRPIRVPPDKASLPGLRAKCAGCGTVFPVAEALHAAGPTPAATAPPPAPPPAAAAPAPPPAVRPAAAAAQSTSAFAVAASATGRAATPASVAATPAAAARPRGSRQGWRRCANHPGVPSHGVCTNCGRGLCADCVTRQGAAAICPSCDALCVSTAVQERKEQLERERARPLLAELPRIIAYPLCDKMAFVGFAIFVGVFALGASIGGPMFGPMIRFVSLGLLYAYAFTAVNRVAAGDTSSFMPQLSDWTELLQPLRAGVAAMLISSGPLIGLTFFYLDDVTTSLRNRFEIAAPAPDPSPSPTLAPEVAALLDDGSAAAEDSEEPGEAEEAEEASALPPEDVYDAAAYEPSLPVWVIPAFVLALLWNLVYSPMALVVAAISRSAAATLNPMAGIDAIRRMGRTYWVAMALYTAIALVQAIAVGLFSLIPLAGHIINGFVQSYTYLVIGSLLGFAVFKKARELNLD